MAPFAVAVCQMPVYTVNELEPAYDTIKRNALKVARAIDVLCRETDTPPRLIAFPALVLSGMGLNYSRRAESGYQSPVYFEPAYPGSAAIDLQAGDQRLQPIVDACTRYDCYVSLSGVEKSAAFGGRHFHSAFVLGPSGLALRSPKVHARSRAGITLLADFYEEYVAVFGEDAIFPVTDTPYGRIACLVETEILVPETARVLAARGAQVVLHSSANVGRPTDPPVEAIRTALACIHAQFWVSASSAYEITAFSDQTAVSNTPGGSLIVAPDGRVLARIDGPAEASATAMIDLEAIAVRRGLRYDAGTIVSPHVLRLLDKLTPVPA
jgi:predicted amidohydrolase